MSSPTETNLDGATTMNLADTANNVVPTDEIKRRLEINRNESITRFSDVKLIGIGGVSEIFSAREPVLNRDIALKILRPASRGQLHLVEGFVREARATAQIDHPNIVPVHEMGVFDDAGVYFTMKKVEGETLRNVLTRLAAGDPEYQRKYTLRRLLEIFIGACQGVAFAHSRGILHCDLKPANLMLGEYGEVLVMDWGLLRYRAERDISSKPRLELDGDLSAGGDDEDGEGSEGILSGTPAFMAPEQIAGGEPDEYTDLYALGAILYCILTQKKSPFDEGLPVQCVLGLGLRGSFTPPRRRNRRLSVPRELEAICLKAMAHHPSQRYTRVTELIRDVRNYLDNYPVNAYKGVPFYRFFKLCKRRPFIPISTVVAALTALGIFSMLGFERQARFQSAWNIAQSSILQGDAYYLQANSTLREWHRAIAAGDTTRGATLERELFRQQAEFENYYQSALEILGQVEPPRRQDEELTEQLAKIFERRLEFALLNGRFDDSRRLLERLNRQHYGGFSSWIETHPRLQKQLAMLREGSGTVELHTTPAAASVSYVPYDATGLPGELISPGHPESFELRAGAYVLIVQGENRPPVYYPLLLNPAERISVNLYLPQNFPDGTVYVPEGKLALASSFDAYPEMAVPGFFIRSTEVTFGEYLRFWKTLADPTLRELYRAYWQDSPGVVTPCWDDAGNLVSPFTPSDPAVGITGAAAEAYCRSLTEAGGPVCRLPSENEWRKAAYGIDRRNYVWGNNYVPQAALLADTVPARHRPEYAGRFPYDRSLYGAFDMSGNVRELVRSSDGTGRMYITKGGSYMSNPAFARRDVSGTASGPENDVGFRYIIELPETP